MSVYILECVVMCLAFTIVTQGLLLWNPIIFLSDYPPEIQDVYYRSQNQEKIKKKVTILMLVKKCIAILVAVILFAWMAHQAGAKTFTQGVLYVFGYMAVLTAFDMFFLDWILFPRMKKIRLPGTEHMDREYHQKWFHVKACIPMIPIFFAAAVVSSYVMTKIW